MFAEPHPYAVFFALLIMIIAAVTDGRTGHIPNWLTLPTIPLALAFYFMIGGFDRSLHALVAMLVVSMVPMVMFFLGAMLAGDVKLFAAVGALVGVNLGIEMQFMGFVVAAIYAMGRMAWQGVLLRSLGNSFSLLFNPFLPKSKRRPVRAELLEKLRLGPSIAAGAILVIVAKLPEILSR